jgi:hypothetical protein
VGEFKYYWFVSIGGILAKIHGDEWQHEIGLGIRSLDQDADMYVTVLDGRYPTENDFDFKSTNVGADQVIIRGNYSLFDTDHLDAINPDHGLIIVVGIKNKAEKSTQFSIEHRDSATVHDVTDCLTNDSKTITLARDNDRDSDNPSIRVFKWYNWEHGNFQIQTRALEGSAKFYLN